MKTRFVLLICWFLIVATCESFGQRALTVTIRAYQATQADGTMRYEYRVENGGPNRVVGFAIGDDYYHQGVSELRVPPKGWDFDKGLAAGTVISPPAWHATLITTEESPFMQLEWRNDGSADILAGQTVTGFSVLTAKPDSRYLSGHWTAFFSDSTIESATLVPYFSSSGLAALHHQAYDAR